jgi:adenine-specific DNA-methyltransferase
MLGEQTNERKFNAMSDNEPSRYNPENLNGRINGKYSNWSREELIDEITKLKTRKKYGIVWEWKDENVVERCRTKLPVLRNIYDKDVLSNSRAGVNFIIEADNYHALSVLNYTHGESIDIIYIDPPYNTGNNDFRFNDNYVDREDSYRHSKWLSFMYRRLKLAKNLLKENGVLFISIDDNELAELKMLLDDTSLFGEKNFIANLIWKSKSGGANDSKFFAIDHEYILVYAKNISSFSLGQDLEAQVSTNYNQQDEKGQFALDRLDKQSIRYSKSLDYIIVGPDGKEYRPEHKDPNKPNATWRWSEETVKERYEELVFKNGHVYTKNYKKEGSVPRSLLIDERFGRTRTGKTDLFSIFHESVFQNPKPVKLIKYLLKIIPNRNALVLDFMAGSGTTGQAVLELNNEDGGDRRFILITNNENNIMDEVCYPRVKDVIEKYNSLKNGENGNLGYNLKYFNTSFVDAKPTDANKKKLVESSTDMLCLKENCFNLILEGEYYKIYGGQKDTLLGIIYDDDGIEEAKTRFRELGLKTVVYIFSLDDSNKAEEFSDLKDLVEVKPIPASILNVYRRIFR